MELVSIHAPAWGATRANIIILHLQQVSIHAPAWGATYAAESVCYMFDVSIHAPAWGATSQSLSLLYSLYSFNPRARVGRDMQSTKILSMP